MSYVQQSDYNSVHDILPPFGKVVELECNGNVFKGSLFDFKRPEMIVRWIVDNPDKIEFSTAVNWKFID